MASYIIDRHMYVCSGIFFYFNSIVITIIIVYKQTFMKMNRFLDLTLISFVYDKFEGKESYYYFSTLGTSALC